MEIFRDLNHGTKKWKVLKIKENISKTIRIKQNTEN